MKTLAILNMALAVISAVAFFYIGNVAAGWISIAAFCGWAVALINE